MKNLRIYSTLILAILLCFTVSAQKLIFSPEIALSNDETVISISNLCNGYINSYKEGAPNLNSMWYNGYEDIIKYSISKNIFYKYGEQFTFNIRKIYDNFYEINTISQINPTPNGNPIIIKIYKVCSKKLNGQFKLFNYFDVIKHTLNHNNELHIDLYYPKSINLREEDIKEADKFVEDFTVLYNIEQRNKIIYVVANSIDECWSILGVT
ncbi:MAG: hypothetical protein LBL90_08590 [Prevotellaceae bacterium]|nr:hypothetical protein [Prevotellaceae bacterium]